MDGDPPCDAHPSHRLRARADDVVRAPADGLTGRRIQLVLSLRLEPLASWRSRAPTGRVLPVAQQRSRPASRIPSDISETLIPAATRRGKIRAPPCCGGWY